MMRLSYKVDAELKEQGFEFPLGKISYNPKSGTRRLHLGAMSFERSAQLSNAQVLVLLSEVVTYSNAKIKIEFEDITLEIE